MLSWAGVVVTLRPVTCVRRWNKILYIGYTTLRLLSLHTVRVLVIHPFNLPVYFVLVTTRVFASNNAGLSSREDDLIPFLNNVNKFGLVSMYAVHNQLEIIFVEDKVVDACGCPAFLKGIISRKTPNRL